MLEYVEAFFRQPVVYQLAVACNLLLLLESLQRLKELRWGVASVVYVTVALWYFVDPVYREQSYRHIDPSELTEAFWQVIAFLFAFRIFVPVFAPNTPSRVLAAFDPRVLSNGRVATGIFLTWAVLFAIGVSRMNFDVVGALFPVKARAAWGNQLWARPRIGGSTDFLISAMGYLYEFICSMFGLLAVGTTNRRVRRWMIAMALLTWPNFILAGARHKILAVAMPSILATLLMQRWTRKQQIVFLVSVLFVINAVMLLVIQYRNVGIDNLMASDSNIGALSDAKHLGLNMTEELVYINRYQAAGRLPVEWGMNYVANAVNFIPRAIWADKPNPGLLYAELRVGRHQGQVAATISNGLVGQGVANFGKWLGPIAPAIILSWMAGALCRFMNRGELFLRACVVFVCLGTIPNLGRDITLFSFWPIIFGVIVVKVYERHTRRELPIHRTTVRPRMLS